MSNIYDNRIYQNDGFSEIVNLIGPTHLCVLDVGCGNGANLSLLKRKGHESWGLTISRSEAEIVEKQGFSVKIWDITNTELPFPEKSFDAILFCHVLEHTAWPEHVLKNSLRMLKMGGEAYIVLPNIMHLTQRWQFLLGHFKYTEFGLMDRTHLRFFDFQSARELMNRSGLEIIHHIGIGKFPMGPFRLLAPDTSQRIDKIASQKLPGLFAFHIVLVGRLVSISH